MFTNWLTSPSTAPSTSVTQTATNSSPFFSQLPTNLMTTPPDCILEVGPPPSVRFVAHSSLLSMHSGYLRSAIRLDENNGNLHNTIGGPMELPPIYLTNVTPEQFGPLLTYMYTGYLDLTVENIFGVLLATHVLHMPRALEICRGFLARSQAEGFLNGNYLNQLNNSNNNNCSELSPSSKNSKIIRPIPSKPIISNLGFIVPPMQHHMSLVPSTDTQFRSLGCSQSIEDLTKISQQKISSPKTIINHHHQKSEESNSSNPSPSENLQLNPIETKSKKSPAPCTLLKDPLNSLQQLNQSSTPSTSTSITKRSPKLKRSRSKNSSSTTDSSTHTNSLKYLAGQNSQSNQNHPSINNQTCSQDNENKVIIDVASCDGPVRFRRVLNDAYGRQPDSVHIPAPQHERSHESVSYSFHQQMAKTICQQRQQQQQSEESENSEDIKQMNSVGAASNQHGLNAMNSTNSNGETFSCVYCKHTFKSQYCYQKHAKRHLNPLSLEQGEGIILAPSATSFRDLFKETKSINSTTMQQVVGTTNATTAEILACRRDSSSTLNSAAATTTTTTTTTKLTSNSSDMIVGAGGGTESTGTGTNSTITTNSKREVRPLDMNVQYYPCKTCGSKFPSYYFVHKHRKMCHANEEN